MKDQIIYFTAANGTEVLLWAVGVLGFLFLIQLCYQLFIYNRLATVSKQQVSAVGESTSLPPLSVIICGENQLEAIQRNMLHILEQRYPLFEVIYVDMASTDETRSYLESLEEEYDHFYVTYLPDSAKYISRRKLAQTIGIKASKYDWLVFTEADCRPSSDKWLFSLAQSMSESTDIVLGYHRTQKISSWFNSFTSYDNLLLQMRFLGLALINQPYMGIGRNMAYRKSLFNGIKAYSNQLNLQRGEDEVFINQTANSRNTKVALHPESAVEAEPFHFWKSWKYMKGSHLLSMSRFNGIKHYLMGFETLTRFLFQVLAVLLLVVTLIWGQWVIFILTLILILLRVLIQWLVVNRLAKQLGEARRYGWSLLLLNFYLPIRTWFLKCTLPKNGKGDVFKV